MLLQVADKIKSCPTGNFGIQLDESTDVAHLAHILIYTRYVHNDNIKNECLFCKPLEITTTASDLFKVVSDFFEGHYIK